MDRRKEAEAARQEEIDAVIAEFDGDPRAAIGALLADIETLARDRAANVSHGYTRGVITIFKRKHCAAQGKVDGDYLVEAWSRDRRTAIIAHCDSVTVGRAAFEAALKRYPREEILLRQGCRVIAREVRGGTKSLG